jgi:hypothetical protein
MGTSGCEDSTRVGGRMRSRLGVGQPLATSRVARDWDWVRVRDGCGCCYARTWVVEAAGIPSLLDQTATAEGECGVCVEPVWAARVSQLASTQGDSLARDDEMRCFHVHGWNGILAVINTTAYVMDCCHIASANFQSNHRFYMCSFVCLVQYCRYILNPPANTGQ